MRAKSWSLLPLFFLATASSVLTAQQQPLSAQPVSPPMMTIPIQQEEITVRLVNETTDFVTYEALGDTQPRTLTAGNEIILQNLNTPASLTFFYRDIPKDRQIGDGLLQAVLDVDNDTGILTIVIRPTTSLDADVSNITIEPNGNVFVF
ncbi:hypothetical protein IQ260_11205 [Leptolyngbya cf. ectocarpi LEGE 11479]|uniref:AMIN domain-containing protein n=1 Tax=Leptolyngbya cf. ectocarpi LEGE 11479 TaxID=1828722 RepID=A0A928X1F3_LEPEC|nr:hypothetical protein [Leptolyngbya ectocarpi]MBE9067224.1 hypothetical protein [Leptolyngbya cf. ectocarpi LEGE 11479]